MLLGVRSKSSSDEGIATVGMEETGAFTVFEQTSKMLFI